MFSLRKEGLPGGARLASFVSAFLVAPFWIVSAESADMYELDLNPYWLTSMIYANVSFLLSALFGGKPRLDL